MTERTSWGEIRYSYGWLAGGWAAWSCWVAPAWARAGLGGQELGRDRDDLELVGVLGAAAAVLQGGLVHAHARREETARAGEGKTEGEQTGHLVLQNARM
ncbi:MAG: hypothetical protein NVSMB62_28910 [Acidobacteriaceae bacterium]